MVAPGRTREPSSKRVAARRDCRKALVCDYERRSAGAGGVRRRFRSRPFEQQARLILHFIEMVVVMFAGMGIFSGLAMLGVMLWRYDEYSHRPRT